MSADKFVSNLSDEAAKMFDDILKRVAPLIKEDQTCIEVLQANSRASAINWLAYHRSEFALDVFVELVENSKAEDEKSINVLGELAMTQSRISMEKAITYKAIELSFPA